MNVHRVVGGAGALIACGGAFGVGVAGRTRGNSRRHYVAGVTALAAGVVLIAVGTAAESLQIQQEEAARRLTDGQDRLEEAIAEGSEVVLQAVGLVQQTLTGAYELGKAAQLRESGDTGNVSQITGGPRRGQHQDGERA